MEILTRCFGIRYTSEHDNLSWTELRDYFGLVLPSSISCSGFFHNSDFPEVFLCLSIARRLVSVRSRISPPKKFPCASLEVSSFLPPSPGQSLTCIVTRDLPHLEFQINGIMLHIGFCAWLLSHRKLFGKCILGVDWTSHRVFISSSFEGGLLLLQINVL